MVSHYSAAYLGLLYMVAGFQQGENWSCKPSYQLGWEFTKLRSRYILLIISSHRTNQRFKARENRIYHLTVEVACMHRDERNCSHPSLQTIYHSPLSGFRLPKSSKTTRHSSIRESALKTNISWSVSDLDVFLRCGFSWSGNLAVQVEEGLKWKRDWGISTLSLSIVFYLVSLFAIQYPHLPMCLVSLRSNTIFCTFSRN